jgi:cellobiose phosphorylase
MNLTDIDLQGFGRFLAEPASFEVARFFTPEPWDYIYTNRKILLRVCHNGAGYAQLDPPGGTVLFKQERFQDFPSFFVWLKPEGSPAFSNFFKPNFDLARPAAEPEEYRCIFTPALATFRLRQAGLEVVTELAVAADTAALPMRVAVRNLGAPRRLDLFPVWRPHNTSSALAPWDVPELYQTCQYCNQPHQAIWIETRDPGGNARLRRRAVLLTDLTPSGAEVDYERFVGKGAFAAPQAVLDGRLGIAAGKPYRYGEPNLENTVTARLPLAAFHKSVTLAAGETLSFQLVLAWLPEQADGSLPPYSEIETLANHFLTPTALAKEKKRNISVYRRYAETRNVNTPAAAFNRYVNEWLPLQLRWVTLLDRGWPTGLRGTRDAAQDATAAIPLFPSETRQTILDICACQRTDGWFVRQFSTKGPEGQHDQRAYVDAGAWVWELIHDYLCFTGDLALLEEKARWLDAREPAPLVDHLQALLGYYLAPENRGEHGLVKIRAGDWNDSVNGAGLEGRGETVMVSCQAVLMLNQAAELFAQLGLSKAPDYAGAAATLRASLRRHALNAEGYLNGVFTDGGEWVFSPRDPDGQRRINSPVNAFGIIAGVFEPGEYPTVFGHLRSLKRDNGYALFLPGIGSPPIAKLGRIGQGDLVPGAGENGTPYNHGSHGFLGRAAAAGGVGDLLWDVLTYMLPYDQRAHPVAVSGTAPYAVVNHWKSLPGQFGRGGATFLSGSIGTALRNVYGGLLGFQPTLAGLRLRPCIPAAWAKLSYTHVCRGTSCEVSLTNPRHVQSGVASLKVNGKPLQGDLIPFAELQRRPTCQIEVVL